MKKILTIVAVASVSAAAFGQGVISWQSSLGNFIGSTNGTALSPFESAAGAPAAAGAGVQGTIGLTSITGLSYYYELLTAAPSTPAPTSLSAFGSTWLDTGLSGNNGTTASTPGRLIQNGATSSATAANTSSLGGQFEFEIVGWSANLGTSWSAALANLNNWSTEQNTLVENTATAAYFGISSFGSSATVNASGVTPGTPVIGGGAGLIYNPGSNPMQMLELPTPTPEPGTLALAALGGASLLLFRRKK